MAKSSQNIIMRMHRDNVNIIRYIKGLIRFIILGFKEPEYDGMQNYERMKFLFDVIRKNAIPKYKVALEIGVYKGCSLIFLSKACISIGINEIYGIDTFKGTVSWRQTHDTYNDANIRLSKYNLTKNVKLIRANSLEYNWNKKIDILHLDAEHTYESIKKDIEKYNDFLDQGSIIIFDDYDPDHPDVIKFVNELLDTAQYRLVSIHANTSDFGSICIEKC